MAHSGTVIKGIRGPKTTKRKSKSGVEVTLDKHIFKQIPFETDPAHLLDADSCPPIAKKLLIQAKIDLEILLSSETDQDDFDESVDSLENKELAENIFMLRLVDKLKEVYGGDKVPRNKEMGWTAIPPQSFRKIPALSLFNKENGWVDALQTLQRGCVSEPEPAMRNSKNSKSPRTVMRGIVAGILQAESSTAFQSAVKNFGYLALALTYVLKASLFTGKTTFPPKYEDMVGEMDSLDGLSSKPSELRGGLNATMISPFTLLSPRGCNAFRNDNSALTMLRWLTAFGNIKPKELLRVERLFYTEILSIVDGSISPFTAVVNFLDAVDELDFTECDDLGYFDIVGNEEESDDDDELEEEEPTTTRRSKRKAGSDADEDEAPPEKKKRGGGGWFGGGGGGGGSGNKQKRKPSVFVVKDDEGWKKVERLKAKMGDIPRLSILEDSPRAREPRNTFTLRCVRNGEEYQYTPAFYPQNPNSNFSFDPHTTLKKILEDLVWVQASTNLEHSGDILAFPYAQLKNFGKEELLKRFGNTFGIVLTERILENKDEFSESVLSKLGLLDDMRQIHDASLDGEREDGNTYIQASLREMYEARDRRGHIMNLLDVPSESGGTWVPLDLAICRQAWMNIQDDEAQLDFVFPMRDMCWYLCGLTDALHDWHVDAQGLATWITILTGKKLWIIGAPSAADPQEHAGIESFNTCQEKSVGWKKYGILLEAGDTLIMPPNTPHFVVTVVDSVVEGGHFYCSSTIQKSCFGIFHVTASYRHVTNNDHSKIRYVLVNILNYWSRYMMNSPKYESNLHDQHFDPTLDIPIVSTRDGLLQFLSLVNIVYLGTVLCPERYDIAVLKGAEKAKVEKTLSEFLNPLYTTSRIYADAALDWLQTRYSVVSTETGEDCWDEVRYGYLVDQARTLVHHRHLWEGENAVAGVSPNLTAAAIEEKITSDFGQYDATLKKLWDDASDSEAHKDYFYHRCNFTFNRVATDD
ncbi:hypothetical protein PM082_023946 [Marasmius tenuissimus]|nr:hypothetical protein PM082_004728 [Marasmius tenuissimus]KAJ8092343.1 hypothetical protein PM082_023946 [Marasmius tenuissimus]